MEYDFGRRKGRSDVDWKHSEAQIVEALKQVDAGRTAAEVGRERRVSKYTIYAWKAKYGGLDVSEAQRLRQLEDENRWLKKLVADPNLGKEVAKFARSLSLPCNSFLIGLSANSSEAT